MLPRPKGHSDSQITMSHPADHIVPYSPSRLSWTKVLPHLEPEVPFLEPQFRGLRIGHVTYSEYRGLKGRECVSSIEREAIESASVRLVLYKQEDEEFICRDEVTVDKVTDLPRKAEEASRLGPYLKLHGGD